MQIEFGCGYYASLIVKLEALNPEQRAQLEEHTRHCEECHEKLYLKERMKSCPTVEVQ